MPELPEVETIKNAVQAFANNALILSTHVYQPHLREPVPADFAEKINGARIVNFERIGKYMIINLNNGLSIIFHFGMSGKIKTESAIPQKPEKHDHIVIITNKGALVYNDTRRFGLVTLCESENLKNHPCFKRIGLDPWDEQLTTEYLLESLKNRKTAIKIALLDQEIICGIGNIYASEILYKSRILPQRESKSITKDEAQKIIKYTREVLEEAIKAGGSTIHDYKRPDGNIGHFQQHHCVYNKEGQRCPDCVCDIHAGKGICKDIQGGRSTFYCPTLQK